MENKTISDADEIDIAFKWNEMGKIICDLRNEFGQLCQLLYDAYNLNHILIKTMEKMYHPITELRCALDNIICGDLSVYEK